MATHFPTLTYGALRLVQRAALGFLAVCALSWYATGVAEAPTPTPATQQRRLRIGIIAPLSGAIATWGQSVQSAIQIAHDEAGQPAELFFEDEGACSATMALSAFRVLTTVKKVDIVIASCLNSARAIAPLAQTSGLPILVSGRSTTEFQQAQPNVLSW
jgi:ABC-type branched-subunit amino acid transport system substrate-binding protein